MIRQTLGSLALLNLLLLLFLALPAWAQAARPGVPETFPQAPILEPGRLAPALFSLGRPEEKAPGTRRGLPPDPGPPSAQRPQSHGAARIIWLRFVVYREGVVSRGMTIGVLRRHRYDAYGVVLSEEIHNTGAGALTDTQVTSGLKYKGQTFDAETGQVYLRNRYYEPETGQFTQVDPARAGENWFAYTTDPVNRWDPSGLDWVWGTLELGMPGYYEGWTWDGKWDGQKMDLDDPRLPEYVRFHPTRYGIEGPQDTGSERLNKDYYDQNLTATAEIVARQFSYDSRDEQEEEASRFKSSGIGHGFLRLTFSLDGNDLIETYSWHPNRWPISLSQQYEELDIEPGLLFDIKEGAYDQLGIDANISRRGRVWKNDPFDLNLKTEVGQAANKAYRLRAFDSPGEVDDLRRYIFQWIVLNRVGFEEGAAQRDPRFQGNTIGETHVEGAGIATRYWVFGQNCFWWASNTVDRCTEGPRPERVNDWLENFNHGVGPQRRFAHHDRWVLEARVTGEIIEERAGLKDREDPFKRSYAYGRGPHLDSLGIELERHFDRDPTSEYDRQLLRGQVMFNGEVPGRTYPFIDLYPSYFSEFYRR